MNFIFWHSKCEKELFNISNSSKLSHCSISDFVILIGSFIQWVYGEEAQNRDLREEQHRFDAAMGSESSDEREERKGDGGVVAMGVISENSGEEADDSCFLAHQ